jgi:NAD(P)H-dependent FMN reductase
MFLFEQLMGCTTNKQYVVLILVGSARKKSINNNLVEEIQHCRVENRLHLKLIIPDLEQLPLFSADIEEQICT